MGSYRVAAWQINCGPDSTPDKNLRKIKSCLQEAAASGARLALFPELSLSGYSVNEDDVLARLRATTPEMIEEIAGIVTSLRIGAVVGLFEESPNAGKVYNVALAIGPDGSRTRCRKTHVPPNEGPFEAGHTGPVVADLGFVRLGLSICFDNWFPESARIAYLRGAEMLHMPFYWPAEWETRDDIASHRVPSDDEAILAARRKRMLKVFPARALDNGLYIVLVDHAGKNPDPQKHLPGKSMVIDPYGEPIAETKGWEEQALYFEFEPKRVREWRENPFFPGNYLRPALYAKAYQQCAHELPSAKASNPAAKA